MNLKPGYIFALIILGFITSCGHKTKYSCDDESYKECNADSLFDEIGILSINELTSFVSTYNWTISRGKEDNDSVFVRDQKNRLIFESKANELQNIHGYGKFYSLSPDCGITAYFLNGERLGPRTVRFSEHENEFLYTFSTSSGEELFSYLQCEKGVELTGHDEINSMLIMYDGTIKLLQGVPFEINIYVPAPPGTQAIVEFSLDSLFSKTNTYQAHPSIRELFTPEILPESTGEVNIFYRYTLFNKSDSILFREIVPITLTVETPILTKK